jgi:hypothetical protein
VLLVGAAPALLGTPIQGYRSWKLLTPHPRQVAGWLAAQCATLSERQLDEIRSHGPHALRWIQVYANPLAAAALQDEHTTELPPGAILAKEKLAQPMSEHPEGVAFMIKHPEGELPSSDGWEFVYEPAAANEQSYDACVACHRVGGTRDYVIGQYGAQDDR